MNPHSETNLMTAPYTHPAVPTDTPWSREQKRILNDFARGLEAWMLGEKPSGPRMVIQAVAGSGKTTVLKAMLTIVRKICPHEKTLASAFNVHIATSLKEELLRQQKAGMSGATILGRNNTMNAGGYQILREEAKRRGLVMSMENPSCPKYRVLSRQVWSEEVGRIAQEEGNQGGQYWPMLDAIAQQMSKPLSLRQLWYRIARDLEQLVTVLQDEGFVPSDQDADNRLEVRGIVSRVKVARGLEESSLWLFLNEDIPIDMACRVLRRGMNHAFSGGSLLPFFDHDELCSEDAIIPRASNHPKTTLIRSEGKYDVGLYPLWKMQTKMNRDTIKYWSNKAQLIWPPMKEDYRSNTVTEDAPNIASFSFTDQIWLPYALDLSLEEDAFQIAFIDEIQDLSVTKGELYRKLLTQDGSATVVLVGDTRQSIMGWSGATPDSVVDNAKASDCKSYDMTYCWRGGHMVATSAKVIMQNASSIVSMKYPYEILPAYYEHRSPDLEGWPNGLQGITITEDEVAHHIQDIRQREPNATIAVVSRLNGALSPIIHQLVSRGVPIATPDNNEIVKGIKWILENEWKPPRNKHEKKGISFDLPDREDIGHSIRNPPLFRFRMLKIWCLEQAIERAGGDQKVAEMEDRYVREMDDIWLAESLLGLYVDALPDLGMETYDYSLSHFYKWIKTELFEDSGNPVYLTSVHRYKGAEADYVFLLRSVMALNRESNTMQAREIFLLPHQVNNSFETAREECNILYVAATRARIQNIQVKAGE